MQLRTVFAFVSETNPSILIKKKYAVCIGLHILHYFLKVPFAPRLVFVAVTEIFVSTFIGDPSQTNHDWYRVEVVPEFTPNLKWLLGICLRYSTPCCCVPSTFLRLLGCELPHSSLAQLTQQISANLGDSGVDLPTTA